MKETRWDEEKGPRMAGRGSGTGSGSSRGGRHPGLQSRQLDVGGYRLWRRLFVEGEVCLEAPRSLEAAIPSSSPLLLSR